MKQGEAVRETLEFLLDGLEVAQVSYLGSASFLDYSQKIGKDNRMTGCSSRSHE